MKVEFIKNKCFQEICNFIKKKTLILICYLKNYIDFESLTDVPLNPMKSSK